MAIQNWSEDITVVELSDDPQLTDELGSLMEALTERPADVVLNFSAVSFINSSNVALMLRLRKIMMANQRRLILCDVNTQVWGVFLVTWSAAIIDLVTRISSRSNGCSTFRWSAVPAKFIE